MHHTPERCVMFGSVIRLGLWVSDFSNRYLVSLQLCKDLLGLKLFLAKLAQM